MQKTQKILLTLSLAFLAGCTPNMTQQASEPNAIQDTTKAAHYFEKELNFVASPYEVHAAINSKQRNITIVDVRAAKAYAAGHIPGAINIPFDEWGNFKGPETDIPGLRKDGYNYIYCYKLGCSLAKKAAEKFAALGYPVKEMEGGFDSWKERHYPIEK